MGFENHVLVCLFGSTCSKLSILKFASFALCAWGFFTISWHLMKDFLQGATIVTSNYVGNNDETLLSPSILICNHTSFKKLRVSTNLKEYLDDTVDEKDIFVDAGLIGLNEKIFVDKIRAIYTPYKGRCFVFEPSIMVICLWSY